VITLIVEFHEEIGFWAFRVEEDGQLIHWRPGFRTPEFAEEVGDAWIRHHLGGITVEEAEREAKQRKADDDAEA
jgi:hypothetical protein